MEKELEKTPARVTFVVPSRADLCWVARSPLNGEQDSNESELWYNKYRVLIRISFDICVALAILQVLCVFYYL